MPTQRNSPHHTHIHNAQHVHTGNASYTPLIIIMALNYNQTSDIQNTTNKAQKTLNMLESNLKQAYSTVKSQAYKTIDRPQLDYASAIWDPHTATLKKYKTMQ